MNQPDYSLYDATQLQQILSRIDAERFPERVAQIEARLAELAAQEPAVPRPAIIADPARYVPVMRRAGKVLLGVAAIDFAVAVWNSAHGAGSLFSVELAALAGALLLFFGGLRAAVVLRWMLFLSIPGAVLWFLLLFVQPLDLTLTQMRLAPLQYSTGILLPLLKGVVWIWVLSQLGSPVIEEARTFEGRKRYDMRKPLALGVVLTLAFGAFFSTQIWGERGRHAEQLAAQKAGGNYRYHANAINVVSNDSGTYVNATVLVWDDKGIGSVAVDWKE